MRNSEAQRYARWSAVVAALLAVVVGAVYLRNLWLARQAEKKSPPPVPSSIEQRSNEFSYSKVEGQRTIYTVKASRTTEFKQDNRNLLEDVSITVYGKEGTRDDTLRTQACDFIASTGKISCAGDVQISLQAAGTPHASDNAIQVATSGVLFDQKTGQAHTDKPATFRWPAGDGRSVGVSYDSNSGIMQLEHNVDVNFTTAVAGSSATSSSTLPQAASKASGDFAGKGLHVSGGHMVFQREARTVLVQGNVHARQSTLELSSESLLAMLDKSFRMHGLVASGHPQVRDAGPHGPITLAANEIVSSMKPDGSIESIVATGSVHGTRTTIANDDQIDAGRVQMELATSENIPRLMTASKGVTLTSIAKSTASSTSAGSAAVGTRTVVTDALEIHFSANSQPGQTLLETVNTLAPARVDWQSKAPLNGRLVAQSTRMVGKTVNLKFDGQNQLQELVSTGGVEVTRKLGEAPEQITTSRELTARFGSGTPNARVGKLGNTANASANAGEWTTIDQTGDVHFHDGVRTGQGDRAHADHAANTVTLDGSVILTDGQERTTAQTATFSQDSNTLRANGRVLSTELGAASAAGTKTGTGRVANFGPEPAHISAEHLVADTARGHAVYSGNGRLWQGQSEVEADTIELDSPSKVMIARGQVRGVFPQAAWSPKPGEAPSQTPARPTAAPESKSSGKSQKGAAGGASRSEPQLGHVRGDLLTYWDGESRARIEHNARVDSQQGSIQADQVDLYFSDTSASNGTKQLSRSVANGDVTVHQDDRRGTSNKAEYTASEGKFVLSGGKPTLYSSTGDTTTGRQLTFFFADDRIIVDSAEGSKTVTLHRVEK